MARAKPRPNIPIFVSSTFTDMQAYRRKVQDALTQLEAVVRGMEQFGSKPGSPVEECLQVVRSCQLYIGVFGMRYGSIPDGFDKSMTHLEYDEAQQLELPSLIYIIDENHPIPPKDVEMGPGAVKLQALKAVLKKRHVVSFYTSPEDLQARVMHDVPVQLELMGVEVAEGLAQATETTDVDILKQFEVLPKLFSGRQITVSFKMSKASSASAADCAALRLEIGATAYASVPLVSTPRTMYVYGEGEMALSLLKIPEKSIVTARVTTVFGKRKEVEWSDDGCITTTHIEIGLVVKEILNIEPPSENAGLGI